MADPLIVQGSTHTHRILQAFSLFSNRPALRWKEKGKWQEMTYAELGAKVKTLAAMLHRKGICPGDRVAIWFETSWQWLAADFAIQLLGAVTVPIYHSLSKDEATYILKDCGAKALFGGYKRMLEIPLELGKSLLKITVDGDADYGWTMALADGERALASEAGLSARLENPPVKPEDISTIIYTSGTTGVPKGAVLTHRNVAGSGLDSLIRSFLGTTSHTMLLHLPMAHIMARNVSAPAILYSGGILVIAEPQRERLPENLIETKPTAFVTVPYLLDKFMSGVLDKIHSQSGIKRLISEYAIALGRKRRLAAIAGGVYRPHRLGPVLRLLDRMILSKIRGALGGKLDFIIIGGANSNRESIEFFWAIGIPVYEGYGATEVTSAATYTSPEAIKIGTVGKPYPGIEVRLAEDGEVFIRGPNVMKEYWNQPDATRESIDNQGWYHTGDVGQMDAEGFLKIIDRKKEIYALSTGKNVAPQGVENALKQSPLIMQAFVAGDRKRYITALIAPDLKAIQRILGIAELSDLKDFRIHEVIQKEIDRVSQKLSDYERIKRFTLIAEPFSMENGLMTPTLKLKRKAIQQKYDVEIDSMYDTQSTWAFPATASKA